MDKKLFMEFANENKKLVTIAGSAMIISIIAALFAGGGFLFITLLLFVLIYYKYNKFVTKKKEDEKLEQKRLEEEKKEAEKKAKLEAFYNSLDIDTELVSILSVLENHKAVSTANFEKGVAQLLEKSEIQISKASVLADFKKALFTKAFDGDNCSIAKSVAVDYFIQDVVKGELLSEYIKFTMYKEEHFPVGVMEPFVKLLYGVAGHAFNYLHNRLKSESYQVLTPDAFKLVIEHSDVLKSYTDTDPFTIDTVREKWANDMYEAPLKMVHSSDLGSVLDNEKYIDEMCYWAYTILCKDTENGGENISVAEIALAYTDFLKELYDRIKP